MVRNGMREGWPHAPPHYFTPHGTYIITGATLDRTRLFYTEAKLNLFRNTTLELARDYALVLQAWAFFANHYHLVASFENASARHRDFVRHLHRELAVRLNSVDNTPRRRVMYEFWDTHLTFEKSWLARLNYVHHNPVHHGLVAVAADYAWCSAPWFETNARPAFVKSVSSFKTDRIKVPDDF
jgi:putative transposase